MLIRFDFKDVFEKIGVPFDNYEGYKKDTEANKRIILKKLWGKVDLNKKKLLEKLLKEYLVINNDYFGTIPLNILYNSYKELLINNKLDIKDIFDIGYKDFLKYKQHKKDKINVFLDFKYKEINPTKNKIEKTLFNFISSIILGYNLNSISCYKIINILLYQETGDKFLIYDFKSVLTNVDEYLIILYFILGGIKFKTKSLDRVLLKTSSKIQNNKIKELLKKEEITFDEFVKIIGINKEIILSQEIGSLIYKLDFTNNVGFEKEKNNIMKKIGIITNEDLFKMLYLYLYFNFK